jgi:hypothetical protein
LVAHAYKVVGGRTATLQIRKEIVATFQLLHSQVGKDDIERPKGLGVLFIEGVEVGGGGGM